MQKSSKRIGEILIEKGLITEAQLHDALQEQKLSDGFLGAIMVEKGWIDKKNLAEALAEQFGIPLVELKSEYIDMELARHFTSSLILDHKCLPIRQDEDSVTVAIINPLNAIAISKIESEAKPRRVNLVLATKEDIDEAIKNFRQYVSESIRRLLKKDKNP
jgi:type IV pilus assembly protein PilB